MLIDQIDSLVSDPILRRNIREFFAGEFMKDAKRRGVDDLEARLRTQFPELENPTEVAWALLASPHVIWRSGKK